LVKDCQDRRVQDVRRHGKYLFLELDRGLLEMHFRFDGHLIWFPNAKDLLRRANVETDESVHVDVALEFAKGVLGFADGRHLGRLHIWESAESCFPLQQMGVDALSREFTADLLKNELKASRRTVKEFCWIKRVWRASAIFIPARRCGTRGSLRGGWQIP
jgi:formamidopyrimidine-DNA glycosylase